MSESSKDWSGSPSPWALGQAWGGELGGRSTGAKALLCLTAEIMLTGEKEKTLVVGAAAGRDMEEAAASGGLEGMMAKGDVAVEPLRKLGDPGTPRLAMPGAP